MQLPASEQQIRSVRYYTALFVSNMLGTIFACSDWVGVEFLAWSTFEFGRGYVSRCSFVRENYFENLVTEFFENGEK